MLWTTENVHHIFTLKLTIVYFILSSRVGLFSSENHYSHYIYIMTYIEVHIIPEKEKKENKLI